MSQNFILVSTPPSSLEKRRSNYYQRDYILLDRSGSMDSRWDEALTAVNTYVGILMKKKVNTKIMAAVFDHEYQIVRRDVASSCAPITNADVTPRGGTALNDAIGRIVAQAKHDDPENAAIVIMTDGEENGSVELTDGQATALLTQCRLRGWQVIFLGIDHDNTMLARRYGASSHEFIAAGKESIATLMAKVAKKRAVHGKTGQAISFSDAEKKDAGKFLLTDGRKERVGATII